MGKTICIAIVVALIGAGCAPETPPDNTAAWSSPPISAAPPDGAAQRPEPAPPSVTPPAAFPDDIPLYDGLTLNSVIEEDEEHMTLIGGTSDDLETVSSFFHEELRAAGWTDELDMTQGETMRLLTFRKDDRAVNVLLMEEESHTTVQLELTGVD